MIIVLIVINGISNARNDSGCMWKMGEFDQHEEWLNHGDFSTAGTLGIFLDSSWMMDTYPTWLVVWLPFLACSHILGMSSSQLTFIFFRGVAQPPTSNNKQSMEHLMFYLSSWLWTCSFRFLAGSWELWGMWSHETPEGFCSTGIMISHCIYIYIYHLEHNLNLIIIGNTSFFSFSVFHIYPISN